ncbi:MAG: hypothetical protein ACTHOR_10590 [Devosia sp.]
MTTPKRLAALVTLALLGTTPVLAQATPAVPADANKTLWCASAFTLVEPQARAQGQISAADNFLKYSKQLSDMSHASMVKAGFTEDQIKSTGATYSDKVNKELTGGGTAEFSVVECTQLVDPQAAALIQAGSNGTGTTTAPANGATAPAGGTAAPAGAEPAKPAN